MKSNFTWREILTPTLNNPSQTVTFRPDPYTPKEREVIYGHHPTKLQLILQSWLFNALAFYILIQVLMSIRSLCVVRDFQLANSIGNEKLWKNFVTSKIDVFHIFSESGNVFFMTQAPGLSMLQTWLYYGLTKAFRCRDSDCQFNRKFNKSYRVISVDL